MRAQYHQCLPNPKRPDEQITVQLFSMWALDYANPEDSLEKMRADIAAMK